MNFSRRKKDSFSSFLFVAPLLVLFLVFFAYPIIYNIIISFYDWNGISLNKVFNGFGNYKKLLADPVMWKCFRNFLWIAVSTTLIQSVLGIILASFFIRKIRKNIICCITAVSKTDFMPDFSLVLLSTLSTIKYMPS